LLRKVWTFLDGDWPLAYKDKEDNNYEALMIINPNKESANLQIKVFLKGKIQVITDLMIALQLSCSQKKIFVLG